MAVRQVHTDEEQRIKDGVYPGIVVSLTEKTITVWNREEKRNEDREVLEWKYAIEVDGDIKTVTGLTGQKITPRTNFGRYIVLLIGAYPDVAFDDDELIGEPCMVMVKSEEKVTDRGTFINNKVMDLLPAMSQHEKTYKVLQNLYIQDDDIWGEDGQKEG
jgi:hypothetical protein